MEDYYLTDVGNWICPKCGWGNVTMKCTEDGDRLACICTRCEYEWSELPLDQREDDAKQEVAPGPSMPCGLLPPTDIFRSGKWVATDPPRDRNGTALRVGDLVIIPGTTQAVRFVGFGQAGRNSLKLEKPLDSSLEYERASAVLLWQREEASDALQE